MGSPHLVCFPAGSYHLQEKKKVESEFTCFSTLSLLFYSRMFIYYFVRALYDQLVLFVYTFLWLARMLFLKMYSTPPCFKICLRYRRTKCIPAFNELFCIIFPDASHKTQTKQRKGNKYFLIFAMHGEGKGHGRLWIKTTLSKTSTFLYSWVEATSRRFLRRVNFLSRTMRSSVFCHTSKMMLISIFFIYLFTYGTLRMFIFVKIDVHSLFYVNAHAWTGNSCMYLAIYVYI